MSIAGANLTTTLRLLRVDPIREVGGIQTNITCTTSIGTCTVRLKTDTTNFLQNRTTNRKPRAISAHSFVNEFVRCVVAVINAFPACLFAHMKC
jgi:hypothetical protein